jgi:DNA-directed RNA polymerase specialized sigma24 family protein
MLDYLMSKYGLRMTIEELSTELKVPVNTLKSRFSNVRTNLKIYRDGKRVFANTESVAEYLKAQSEK